MSLLSLSDITTRWYTGHPQDPETGLVYAGARYYDPAIGRFLAVDPLGFIESNPPSFNRYAYGNNSPYRYVDPDGNVPVDTVIDLGFVIYDAGQFLGAGAAYLHGVISGDPALVAAGRAGLAESGVNFGGSLTGLAIPYAPAAVTRGVTKSVTPTARQIEKFQKQLREHGIKSLERSQRKIERRLNEHLEKLDEIRKVGGHTSSIEREIRNFERELEAIKQALGGG